MPYTPAYLILEVEALGAKWWFQSPDKALARLMGTVRVNQEEGALDTDRLDPEQAGALLDAYHDGLTAWEGVMDPANPTAPLPFNRRNVELIPTTDKLLVAAAFLNAALELQAGKVESGERPSNSMPPLPASPDPTCAPTSTAP